jgi:type II secretory ATPase GspE/PulE/Tfp pilus assembly ATPase PilB-like protein
VLTQTRTGTAPADLPFNPVTLVCLVVWVYLCLYLVQRVQFSYLVPKAYKGVAKIATLFTGPIPLLILFILDVAEKSRQRQENLLTVLKEQVGRLIDGLRAIRFEKKEEEPTIRLLDTSGRSLDEIYGHSKVKSDDAKSLDLTENMIADALDRRASDILIDAKDDSMYTIRLRIDGRLTTTRELNADTCHSVINSIKAVSGMDISERRRPQDGGFIARKGDTTASFRVASAGALNGEKLSIRILNKDAGTLTLADIGITSKQGDRIKEIMAKPSGMILICGPTGSGKTTTMYAMLNEMDRFTRNVITVEDPIECMLPQTSQIEINSKADITFAGTLRSVLRQDPDVICIGEIRDEETADIALRASQTGHLVVATIHCDSNVTALIRLIDLGVSRLLLSSGLSLVMSQRLLRCLCKHCKKPASLSDSQIVGFKKSGFDPARIFEAGGCKHCEGTGYFGRTAICDLLVVDGKHKAEIANDESLVASLKTEESKAGRSGLRKYGMKKVLEGITSLEELKRVIG